MIESYPLPQKTEGHLSSRKFPPAIMAQGRKSDTGKNVVFFCGRGIVSFSCLPFQMRRDVVAKRYKNTNREHKKVAFDDSSQNLSVEC